MCDYSLTNVKSRPAVVGDKIRVHDFGTGTKGFAPIGENIAVCVRPGTEIAFDGPIETVKVGMFSSLRRECTDHTVAIFRQINRDKPSTHHDALETPDGKQYLLTLLTEGQTATVLQLPAEPKNEAEAEEQRRLEVAG